MVALQLDYLNVILKLAGAVIERHVLLRQTEYYIVNQATKRGQTRACICAETHLYVY